MSSAGWISVALLFIIPFCEASKETAESAKIPSRHTRSIMNLRDMVKSITGRDGEDFLSYGNWCGLGGSGRPVDPIDECCQNHDICYDLANNGVCKDHDGKAIYFMEYKWSMANDQNAVCEDQDDQCKRTICLCDAIISNCLKSNIDYYNPKNRGDTDIYQLFEDSDYVS